MIKNKKIKNFKMVKKNDTIAVREGKAITSKKDFYPILFGEKAYKDIFGFSAIKVNKL